MTTRRPGRAASRGTAAFAVVAVAVLLALVWWAGRDGDAGAGTGSGATTVAAATPTATTTATRRPSAAPPPARDRGTLPVVRESDLPVEARETLDLIAAGGPFPYDRDGATFQNRERLLPRHPPGWYREYTVPTPGEDDRGARRIVTGRDGTAYWTDDHYGSFSVIEEEP